jgi:hypothetical protein
MATNKPNDKPTETQALARTAKEQFPVLAYDQGELADLIKDNLGGMMPRLTRISWPTGGALQFKVSTDEGDQLTTTLTGLVVHHVPNRLFWEESFEESGGGEIPDCSSADGIMGIGSPHAPRLGLIHPMLELHPGSTGPFSCGACPLSKFRDGERPACRETHPLFLIPRASQADEINLLPIVVSVPPSSLSVWSTFAGQLLQRGISFRRAIVEIGLELDKGGPRGNIDYSKMKIRRVGLLSPEEWAFMREYARSLEPLFEQFSQRAVETVLTEEAQAEVSTEAGPR